MVVQHGLEYCFSLVCPCVVCVCIW